MPDNEHPPAGPPAGQAGPPADKAGTPPEAYLVLGGGAAREVHRLERLPARIGRSPDSDILIADPRVSRSHAIVDWVGERFVIEDLGSTNGTTVNGTPISEAIALSDGDAISIAGVGAVFQVNAPTMVVQQPLAASGLHIDPATHEVSVNGEPVKLSPKEYLFLAALHRRAGSVVSHEEIVKEVWPEVEEETMDESVHQLARRVRRKLVVNAQGAGYVLTVKGFGYRLAADA